MGVEDVLDADRHAVQRAPARLGIARAGLGQRVLAIDMAPGVQVAVARGDAGETSLDQGDRGGRALLQPLRHFQRGQEIEPARSGVAKIGHGAFPSGVRTIFVIQQRANDMIVGGG